MKFARWVFAIAGVYGILALAPHYFLEERIGRDLPPAITHLEYFYGFVGVALAFQAIFLLVASDPIRYRPAMIPCVLEKASFAVATAALHFAGRLPGPVLAFGLIDFVLGSLFVAAFIATRPSPAAR